MSHDPDIHHGFKRLSAENWQMPDVTKFYPNLTPETWSKRYLLPQLDPKVPTEIAALFEVARGSMIYGWYFYPLLTLAAEQLYRVVEAAARQHCETAGIPTHKPAKPGKAATRATNFDENIKALVKTGIISQPDLIRWDATRQLRNWASHPNRQLIQDPGQARSALKTSAELINRLFA